MNTETYKLRTPPPPVGGYRMGDETDGGWILFNLPKKPLWIHRMGVRLVPDDEDNWMEKDLCVPDILF